ncbi:hypothetical protein THAOC_05370 [Thalassiosira oceanica]|uniref:Uncharacterized protein n=1 Tax=Thalassiosira oceanica TaxID=159749 RepID=K0TMW1_THAOC|nr:hypothetical protein THAOC_05370 [Thalassiosira oceanica]|eukprot:EJK73032.1 hypothetical protein THAOC_05370 [Thalassiosira oceanica]
MRTPSPPPRGHSRNDAAARQGREGRPARRRPRCSMPSPHDTQQMSSFSSSPLCALPGRPPRKLDSHFNRTTREGSNSTRLGRVVGCDSVAESAGMKNCAAAGTKTGTMDGNASGGKRQRVLQQLGDEVFLYVGGEIARELRSEITRVRIGPQVKDISDGAFRGWII